MKYNYYQNINFNEIYNSAALSFSETRLISEHRYAGNVTLEQIVLNTSKRNYSAGKCHILSEIKVPKWLNIIRASIQRLKET